MLPLREQHQIAHQCLPERVFTHNAPRWKQYLRVLKVRCISMPSLPCLSFSLASRQASISLRPVPDTPVPPLSLSPHSAAAAIFHCVKQILVPTAT
jgi:hypothetical protein